MGQKRTNLGTCVKCPLQEEEYRAHPRPWSIKWERQTERQARDTSAAHKRHGFGPWVGKIPWKREWQPTPVFLPGKSHGQRSLVGYSPWGAKSRTRLRMRQVMLLWCRRPLAVNQVNERPRQRWQECRKGNR